MTISQWNINGYYAHLAESNRLEKLYKPMIIALQETKLRKQDSPSMKTYSIFRLDNSYNLLASGSAALLVRSFHSPTSLPPQTNFQAVAVQLIINNLQLTICNIYLPPEMKISLEEIRHH